MNPFDTPTSQPKEKITGKHVAVVAILAILIMLPFAGMVVKQRMDAAAKAEAARVANIQKEQATKLLAVMKQDYPRQPKELKKMVKIARGTTQTVKVTAFNYGNMGAGYPVGANCYAFGEALGYENGTEHENGYIASWTPFNQHFDDEELHENIVDEVDVSITVPQDADLGVQTMWIGSLNPDNDDWFSEGSIQFEVVCMKVTLKLIPSSTVQ